MSRAPEDVRAYEPSLRVWTWNHPEWWVLASSALAWLETLAMMSAEGRISRGTDGAMAPQSGMPMAGVSGHAQAWTLGAWSLMVIAMMAPLAVGPLRVTAARSLWRRRQRATVEYMGGFTGIWVLAGGALLAARMAAASAGWLAPSAQRPAMFAALMVAAAWQLTPSKRRALLACHRAYPLAPSGWRSVRDCLRSGARTGCASLRSCGVMMAALVLGDMALGAMIVVAALALAECYATRPRFGATAGVLVALAVVTLLT